MPKITVRTQAEIAQFFDLSIDTIKNWAKQGMPGRPGAYDLGAIVRWARVIGPHRTDQAIRDALDRHVEGNPERNPDA